MAPTPKTRPPQLLERTFRHVSWRQGRNSGVWLDAAYTQECLAVASTETIQADLPVQLRLILSDGEMVLTQGVLTSRLEEGQTPLMLFTLALTQADLAAIRDSPPPPVADGADELEAGPDRLHQAAMALVCAALATLAVAVVLLA